MSYLTVHQQLAEMIKLASACHLDQFDEAGKPYILHPIYVMNGVMSEWPEEPELAIIAIGHDLFEDCYDDAYKEIMRSGKYCSRVISGITAITKWGYQSKEEYQEAVLSNYDATRVKKWDLQHNSCITRLKGVTEKDLTRIEYYHKFYLRILKALSEFTYK